uniref:Uncharacterized protein n=2 Tax=Spongospora subterranea TaxID=70186 RepID=A0A0H5RDH7_9EUKA|eukprot:CRZ11786.1 hypothetical protein [Spongospora subterranea]
MLRPMEHFLTQNRARSVLVWLRRHCQFEHREFLLEFPINRPSYHRNAVHRVLIKYDFTDAVISAVDIALHIDSTNFFIFAKMTPSFESQIQSLVEFGFDIDSIPLVCIHSGAFAERNDRWFHILSDYGSINRRKPDVIHHAFMMTLNGHTKLTDIMLEAGATIDAKSCSGETALQCLVMQPNKLSGIIYCITHGASLRLRAWRLEYSTVLNTYYSIRNHRK